LRHLGKIGAKAIRTRPVNSGKRRNERRKVRELRLGGICEKYACHLVLAGRDFISGALDFAAVGELFEGGL
jgi:hypothetical protein